MGKMHLRITPKKAGALRRLRPGIKFSPRGGARNPLVKPMNLRTKEGALNLVKHLLYEHRMGLNEIVGGKIILMHNVVKDGHYDTVYNRKVNGVQVFRNDLNAAIESEMYRGCEKHRPLVDAAIKSLYQEKGNPVELLLSKLSPSEAQSLLGKLMSNLGAIQKTRTELNDAAGALSKAHMHKQEAESKGKKYAQIREGNANIMLLETASHIIGNNSVPYLTAVDALRERLADKIKKR